MADDRALKIAFVVTPDGRVEVKKGATMEDEKQAKPEGPIKTGARLRIDFGNMPGPGCVAFNGKEPTFDGGWLVGGLTIAWDGESRGLLPEITIRGTIIKGKTTEEFVQVGAFVAEADVAEFMEWRRLRDGKREGRGLEPKTALPRQRFANSSAEIVIDWQCRRCLVHDVRTIGGLPYRNPSTLLLPPEGWLTVGTRDAFCGACAPVIREAIG